MTARITRIAAISCLSALLAGCSLFAESTQTDVEQSLIGMSKSRLMECAGAPDRIGTRDSGAEVLSYFGGADPMQTEAPDVRPDRNTGDLALSPPSKRYCEARLTIEGKHVVRADLRESAGNLLRRSRECERLFRRCMR